MAVWGRSLSILEEEWWDGDEMGLSAGRRNTVGVVFRDFTDLGDLGAETRHVPRFGALATFGGVGGRETKFLIL